jgi:hypothetical protein
MFISVKTVVESLADPSVAVAPLEAPKLDNDQWNSIISEYMDKAKEKKRRILIRPEVRTQSRRLEIYWEDDEQIFKRNIPKRLL